MRPAASHTWLSSPFFPLLLADGPLPFFFFADGYLSVFFLVFFKVGSIVRSFFPFRSFFMMVMFLSPSDPPLFPLRGLNAVPLFLHNPPPFPRGSTTFRLFPSPSLSGRCIFHEQRQLITPSFAAILVPYLPSHGNTRSFFRACRDLLFRTRSPPLSPAL